MPPPRKFEVVTAMNADIYRATGRRMLRSLSKMWPSAVTLYVDWEGDSSAVERDHPDVIFADRDPAREKWMRRYRHHPGQDRLARCAWRFAYKSFAVTAWGADSAADVLIWMDADTYTHRELPMEVLESWLPEGKWLTYLGRKGVISECGFVMYDLRQPVVREMLKWWREVYTSGALFSLAQWNDCFVFDRAREGFVPKAHWNDLTPWAKGFVHAFINSPLGAYMDHMKGGRKAQGSSRRRDVIRDRVTPEFQAYLDSN